MNQHELLEEIESRIARGTVPIDGLVKQYMTCEKCQAEFKHLILGGSGDWKSTITCTKCFHIRRGVPHSKVLVPLIALQYGIAELHARHREERIEDEWIKTVARSTL